MKDWAITVPNLSGQHYHLCIHHNIIYSSLTLLHLVHWTKLEGSEYLSAYQTMLTKVTAVIRFAVLDAAGARGFAKVGSH